MECYRGKSVFQKIAIGRVFLYQKREHSVKKGHTEDAEQEVRRFETAKSAALSQLHQIYQKAEAEAGEANAAVFEAHMTLLRDRSFADFIFHMIRGQKVNAEYAVAAAGEYFSNMFAEMDDDYMKARAEDVKDITGRLISILDNRETDVRNPDEPLDLREGDRMVDESMGSAFDEPVILMADDLTPSETVQLDKSGILAFVTRRGSVHSHAAILARSMNIPAITGIDIREEWDGKTAVVDGYTGEVTIDPDPEYLEKMTAKMGEDEKEQDLLKELKGKETVTKGGKRIHLYANISSVKDVDAVLQNGGEGIGLLRSEFLYLESEEFPTEDQLFWTYRTVAEKMQGKKVIVRTLDIGADKQADYFGLEKEDNPAMGYRAVRICLGRPEIFKTQLRAILRASVYGNISIMFPMIISVQEVQECKRILAEAKNELEAEGIACKDVDTGVMIETPAAVWISEELAREVDFFSIGTNDLTQYTLAIDRQNAKLDPIRDTHHPAILRSIQMVVENGHKGGAWVGICGELAADLSLTKMFLDMGMDELSVSPSLLLSVRDAVRKLG
ncbi:MAG: phosphoenolpyruvate--protein phosphotransferase [Clostridiales bacterium]|nr:phosphoenolpyruvate--protein phosphotransferase [Clostridiales bacterium]